MTPAIFYALLGSPFGYSVGYGDEFHAGQDYPWGRGVAIPSFGRGRVITKGYSVHAGYYVTILINGKYFLFYHLLYSSDLNVGDTVEIGDTVGMVGTSGKSTGFHLHLAASNNPMPGQGWRVNPVPLVADALAGGSFAGGGDLVYIEPEKEDEDMLFIKHPTASKWFLFWGDYGQAETENSVTAGYWGDLVGHASDKTVPASAITHEKARRLDRYNQMLKDISAGETSSTVIDLDLIGNAVRAAITSALAGLAPTIDLNLQPVLDEVAKIPTAAENAAEVRKALPVKGTFSLSNNG